MRIFRSIAPASPKEKEQQQRQSAAQNRQDDEPFAPCNKRDHNIILLRGWFPGTSATSPCSFSKPPSQEAPTPLGSPGMHVARAPRTLSATTLSDSNTAASKAANRAAITARKSGTPNKASSGVLAVQHTGAASPAGNNR